MFIPRRRRASVCVCQQTKVVDWQCCGSKTEEARLLGNQRRRRHHLRTMINKLTNWESKNRGSGFVGVAVFWDILSSRHCNSPAATPTVRADNRLDDGGGFDADLRALERLPKLKKIKCRDWMSTAGRHWPGAEGENWRNIFSPQR